MSHVEKRQGSTKESGLTPAMIEAGARALQPWLPDGEAFYFAERAAEEVYLAMYRAERAASPDAGR